MSEQIRLTTRLIHKHDTEANWNNASTFIPEQGEIIIYDIDNIYYYERVKIGDGKTSVINLPFYMISEIQEVVSQLEFLASNMLQAEWKNNTLFLTKGIEFPV